MSKRNIVIHIPFTPPRTDKNSRTHWRTRYGLDDDAKMAAFHCAREANIPDKIRADTAEIVWTIYLAKGAHKSDLDNMIGRLKAFQDGIFLALGLDDGIVKSIKVNQERDPDGMGRTVATVTLRAKGVMA